MHRQLLNYNQPKSTGFLVFCAALANGDEAYGERENIAKCKYTYLGGVK